MSDFIGSDELLESTLSLDPSILTDSKLYIDTKITEKQILSLKKIIEKIEHDSEIYKNFNSSIEGHVSEEEYMRLMADFIKDMPPDLSSLDLIRYYESIKIDIDSLNKENPLDEKNKWNINFLLRKIQDSSLESIKFADLLDEFPQINSPSAHIDDLRRLGTDIDKPLEPSLDKTEPKTDEVAASSEPEITETLAASDSVKFNKKEQLLELIKTAAVEGKVANRNKCKVDVKFLKEVMGEQKLIDLMISYSLAPTSYDYIDGQRHSYVSLDDFTMLMIGFTANIDEQAMDSEMFQKLCVFYKLEEASMDKNIACSTLMKNIVTEDQKSVVNQAIERIKTEPPTVSYKSMMNQVGDGVNSYINNRLRRKNLGNIEKTSLHAAQCVKRVFFKNHSKANNDFVNDIKKLKTISSVDNFVHPEDTDPKVQAMASNEYLANNIAYANIKDGQVIPIAESDGKVNIYRTKTLTNEDGFVSYALIPVDPTKSQDIKVTFRGMQGATSHALNFQSSPGHEKWQSIKQEHSKALSKEIEELTRVAIASGIEEPKISVGSYGHGLGGSESQEFMHNLANIKLYQEVFCREKEAGKSDEQIRDLLKDSVTKQIEYEKSLKNPDDEFEVTTKIDKAIESRTDKLMKQMSEIAEMEQAGAIDGFKKVTKMHMNTHNSTGVQYDTGKGFADATKALRINNVDKDKLKISANIIHTKGDMLHRTGERDNFAKLSEDVADINLAVVDKGIKEAFAKYAAGASLVTGLLVFAPEAAMFAIPVISKMTFGSKPSEAAESFSEVTDTMGMPNSVGPLSLEQAAEVSGPVGFFAIGAAKTWNLLSSPTRNTFQKGAATQVEVGEDMKGSEKEPMFKIYNNQSEEQRDIINSNITKKLPFKSTITSCLRIISPVASAIGSSMSKFTKFFDKSKLGFKSKYYKNIETLNKAEDALVDYQKLYQEVINVLEGDNIEYHAMQLMLSIPEIAQNLDNIDNYIDSSLGSILEKIGVKNGSDEVKKIKEKIKQEIYSELSKRNHNQEKKFEEKIAKEVKPDFTGQPEKQKISDQYGLDKLQPLIGPREFTDTIASPKKTLAGEKSIYGYRFADKESTKTNGMEIVFGGTGTSPAPGKHKCVEEGDMMFKLAHDLSEDGTPSMFMRGIGTNDTGRYGPMKLLDDPNLDAASSQPLGTVVGHGLSVRVKVALEKFVIPNLFNGIAKEMKNGEIEWPRKINIQGHSRGAITAMAFTSCIDSYFSKLIQLNDNELKYAIIEIKQQCNNSLSENEIKDIINKIKQEANTNGLPIATNAVYIDPVEGALRDINTYFDKDHPEKGYHNSQELCGIKQVEYRMDKMPPTLHDACYLIAEADRRESFKPTLATVAENTRVRVQQISGSHSTMTGNIGNCDGLNGQYGFEESKNCLGKLMMLATSDLGRIEVANQLAKSRDSQIKIPTETLRRAIILASMSRNHDDKLFKWLQANIPAHQKTINNLAQTPRVYYHMNIDCCVPGKNPSLDSVVSALEQSLQADKEKLSEIYPLLENQLNLVFSSKFTADDEQLNLIHRSWQHSVKEDSSALAGGLRLRKMDAKDNRGAYIAGRDVRHEDTSLNAIPGFNTRESILYNSKMLGSPVKQNLFTNPKFSFAIETPEGASAKVKKAIENFNEYSQTVAQSTFLSASKKINEENKQKLNESCKLLAKELGPSHPVVIKMAMNNCFLYDNAQLSQFADELFPDQQRQAMLLKYQVMIAQVENFNNLAERYLNDKNGINFENLDKITFELQELNNYFQQVNSLVDKNTKLSNSNRINKAKQSLQQSCTTAEKHIAEIRAKKVQDRGQKLVELYKYNPSEAVQKHCQQIESILNQSLKPEQAIEAIEKIKAELQKLTSSVAPSPSIQADEAKKALSKTPEIKFSTTRKVGVEDETAHAEAKIKGFSLQKSKKVISL